MNKISVVINTYNNEAIIRECLDSVKDFDEIVICDMYSTDNTLNIAKEYNCKIVMHEKLSFVEPARNFAIQSASHNWVLVVDSDELITKELKEFLYKFIENPQNNTAIKLPRITYGWGSVLEILYPDYIIRFFRKDVIYYPPYVHSTPQISNGEILTIEKEKRELAILHMQNRSVAGWINMINLYTDLEMEKFDNKGKPFNIAFHSWKSFVIFFEKFIFKGGYKDGIKGFIICALMFGLYKLLVGFKYWEKTNKK